MSRSNNHVVLTLRQKILSGELAAGTRLAEIPTAENLGVSRTPVRIAFRALEQEGLLTKLPRRGYEVRTVSTSEIEGAVEVRGVLEGLAARQAAERGLTEHQRQILQSLLDQGDALVLNGTTVTEAALEQYQQINKQFHDIIIEAAQNPAIQAALSRSEHLPFASASALAFDPNNMAHESKRFAFAHQQHHHVFYAIIQGLGTRAEGIMREHANATFGFIHGPRNEHNLTIINGSENP